MLRRPSAPLRGRYTNGASSASSSAAAGAVHRSPRAWLLALGALMSGACLLLSVFPVGPERALTLHAAAAAVAAAGAPGAGADGGGPRRAPRLGSGSGSGGGTNSGGGSGGAPRLQYPLWWHAPFVAESGLGAEATMIVQSLVATGRVHPGDLYISHSGDDFDAAALRNLPPQTRQMLSHRQHPQQVADEWLWLMSPEQRETQARRLRDFGDARRAIAVCQQWPECIRIPGDAEPSNFPGCPCPLGANRTAYVVARAMFEAAGLPESLARHLRAADEVWVPTAFNRDSFAAAGIPRSKLRIVPEGIDTGVWDPARLPPRAVLDANVSALGLRQATGPPAAPLAVLAPPRGGRTAAAAPPAAGAAAAGVGGGGGGAAAAAAPTPPSAPPSARARPYVFLSVFKWEARKGWQDLVAAFARAFNADDDAVLWILTKPFMADANGGDSEGFALQQIQAFLAREAAAAAPGGGASNDTSSGGSGGKAGGGAAAAAAQQQQRRRRLPRIYVSAAALPEQTLRSAYLMADAYASATHGEGWGRPQLEAMALELPVISTNWSGTTAFLNDAVGYPLRVDGLETVRADAPGGVVRAFVGQQWAKPSRQHLAELMRRVYERPDEARAKGRAARAHVRRHFTPEVVAGVVAREVARLQGVIAARDAAAAAEDRRRGRRGGGAGASASSSSLGALLSGLGRSRNSLIGGKIGAAHVAHAAAAAAAAPAAAAAEEAPAPATRRRRLQQQQQQQAGDDAARGWGWWQWRRRRRRRE